MIARIFSSILQGIDAVAGEVEVDVARGGLGELKLVGLADTTVKESVSRIQAALRNSGYRWPGPKVTINLAPADVRKDSGAFDLPIALTVMMAGGMLESDKVDDYLVVGELALDGRVRPIRGALATAMLARQLGKRGVICPAENAAEAAVVEGVEVIGVGFLSEAVGFLGDQLPIDPVSVDLDRIFAVGDKYDVDFADVRGQESAKRALTIAAAGHHNILMIGPPGSGKTMLAKRIPSILPPLTPEESLETTRIYSSRGLLEAGQSLIVTRPVRMPHHSTSSAALVGGGVIPQPGEISLAHHGVLFLDELPEFSRTTLEMIRQPLEDRCVTIPRVHSTIRFPASIMLVGAMNPCPCGYFTDPKRPCKCSPFTIERYMGRLSGPLIDRIDIHIEVPPVAIKDLRSESPRSALDSAAMRSQVVKARAIQRERFTKWAKEHPMKSRTEADSEAATAAAGRASDPSPLADGVQNPSPLGGGRAEGPGEGSAATAARASDPSPLGRGRLEEPGEGYPPDTGSVESLATATGGPAAPSAVPASAGGIFNQPRNPSNNHTHGSTTTNATMSSRQIRHFCKLDAAGEVLLKQAMTELGLSARAHDKVLRIARTIADLEAAESIQAHHLAEAIQYRRLDRKL